MNKNYWINELKDVFSFIIINENKSEKNYRDLKINFTDELIIFLDKNNCSMVEFITGILTVYFSRTKNTIGCIFNYKNKTLFKIKYDENKNILKYLSDVKKDITKFNSHPMDDFKGFIENNYPEIVDSIYTYSITDLNDNYDTNSIINFKIGDNFLEIQYDANSFNNKEINSLCNNIEALIFNCLKDFDLKCGEIGIISDDELKLINKYSQGSKMHVDELNIPDIIKNTSNKYPDNNAINDEVNRITYKKLDELINSTAIILQNKYNIKKNDKIVLYLSRTYNFPVLTLSLMKLGAISIPVDDTYPINYVNDIISDCSPKFLVCEKDYGFKEINTIYLEDLDPKYCTGDFNNVDVDLDDTAIILYTSGTTGNPKGVEITQRNIIHINYNYANYFNLTHESGYFMCLAKFTFVASIPVYGSLMVGFEAFIIRDTTKESIPKIVKYLMTSQCSVLISTQELGLYLYNNFDLNIDFLALSGSKLVKSTIKKGNKTKLLNGYGCTETTGSVIINEIDDEYSNYSVIGRPFANCKVYILDDNKQQVPLGTIGEIVISGPTVSKQYYNNPKQTDKAYGIVNNEKAHFTNDLGYFNYDGEIVYVGRKDSQINLNGFRIEPEGIESNILKYGDINQVKVIVNKINNQDHLIAYYSSPKEIDEDSLKEFLSIHLPSYMVPSFYIQMEALPLNPNGKIDIRQLPAVEFEKVDYVKSRNEFEEKVVNSFENAFNQKNISIYDDFIQLGGTSVIAMKILSQLNEFNLSVQDLVTLGSPQKIAEHIKNDSEYLDLNWDKYSLESGCPLNEPQLNVYLDIQRYGKNEEYNLPLTINIPDTYSKDDVDNALNKIFNIHPILKTHIETNDEMPYLKSGNNPKIEHLDEYNEDYILNFMNNSFDLENNLSRYLLVNDNNNLVLVAVFHHLIFDGFSSLVFKQHLSDLLEGKTLEYDDAFIKSSIIDENISESSKYMEAKNFYETMLSEADEISPLLTDIGDIKSGKYSFDLKIDKSDITNFLKTHNITENILFTSVFAYTLSRFTGDDRVLFNIVENGRDKLNNFNSIGMFVNTLPLLVNCKNQQISSFMADTSDLIYNVMKYNYYPFRLLAKEYDVNLNIIFQYMPYLATTEDDNSSKDLFDKTLEDRDDVIGDFNVNINQKKSSYNISIAYSDKFSSDYVERFINTYKLILQEMIICNELSEMNYISNSDLMLLDSYNKTEHDLVYDDILNAFNDNLMEYPNNKLVLYNDTSYTYGEGAFIADKIAQKLIELGVKTQDCVSFLVERSELYMFCILGIMSMGGIYVPVDDKLPDERIKFILEDTDSSVVIVSDETYNRAENLINNNVTLLNISDIINGEIGTLSNLPTCYGDLACILYTSGTTGIPKGVKITRKSIINFAHNYIKKYDLSQEDIFALFASIGFDVSMESIFSSIYAGACLNIIPDDIKLDMDAMNKHFIENGVTYAHLPAQIAKLFINQNNTSLKVLCTGGEKLGDIEITPVYRFVDTYGPTETFIDVSSINIADKIDSSSIGYLFDNIKVYVLDEELRRVPISAVGELYIAGYQVAKGYLNRPKETDEVFLENPYDTNEDYSVMYRTGDMVRVLPDGSLGIVGRHDNQVKIRGNRVELSEIETVIREIEYINDVTIQTIKHDANNVLVAYVVISNEMSTDNLKEEISKYVGDRKPDYMVPSFVIKLNEIPLNINGKVDKRALPEVDFDLLHADYVAPRDEKEKNIVEAFEKVFNMENISIHDDFIRLGGDSITAIKLIHYIDSDSITMADILKLRTPEAIAKNIDDITFDLDIYSLEEGCPLNSAQINVLADVTIYNKTNAYHIPNFIKIPKKYSLEHILDALDKLLEAHPILSMRLSKIYEVNEENKIGNVELIRDSISIAKKFGIKDIMGIVKSYGIRNVKGLYNMLQTAMKLLKGEYPYLIKGEKPPISVHRFDKNILIDFVSESLDLYNHLSKFMIMESEDSYYLFFVIHHIIFDATSHRVFNKDFQTILDGGSVDMDETFLKVSAFTHHMKNTEKFDEASEFFGSQLADVNEAGILTEENPSATGYTMSQYDMEIDENVLNSYLKNTGISANVLFTSVFAYSLSKFVEKDKVLFTMIENGRDRFNEDFIDMTSNVMPLLIDCKDQSINSFLENSGDIIYGTMKHSYYPILLLYQKYNFEVGILFQYIPDWVSYKIEDIEDISSSEIINHVLNSYNDFLSELFVQVNQKGKNISLIIVNSKRYSDEKIKDLMETYVSILSNIINTDKKSTLSSILNEDHK